VTSPWARAVFPLSVLVLVAASCGGRTLNSDSAATQILAQLQDPDGGIYGDRLKNYETCVSIVAFRSAADGPVGVTVIGTGEGVEQSWAGRRVMGFCQSAYAEQVVVPESVAIPVPEDFSVEEAAAFPVVFLTAYAMLKISAKARSGETILVHAAAGGVGTAAVQLAKRMGLQVIATASSEEKLGRVRELGADFTVNYKERDFVQPVLDFTGGRGADIIFESVGGDFVDRDIDASAPFGRIVVFGLASGSMQPPNMAKMFRNSVAVSAFWMFTLVHQASALREMVRELLSFVSSEGIRPNIGRTYPLSDASEALTALESRNTYGKLVLKP
jgi:NADPH2:quinone reductase